MPLKTLLLCFVILAAYLQTPQPADNAKTQQQKQAAIDLRNRIEASPTLPFQAVILAAQPPSPGWQSGAVSSVAISPSGLIYELQRGDDADPVLVLDADSKIVRSWGKGDFKLPHSIRLDPAGNIWTVDANSSNVIQYSPLGKKLLTIEVGGQPKSESPFNGTTDLAFATNGHIFITDGYANARILEYTAQGKLVGQWGKPGSNRGEFHLPHAIQINDNGVIYIADRENGRIQIFNQRQQFIGEFDDLGRVHSIKISGEFLWISTQTLDQPPGSPGWILKLNARTGTILGHIDVPEMRTGHSIDVTPSGEPVITFGNQLLWFKSQ